MSFKLFILKAFLKSKRKLTALRIRSCGIKGKRMYLSREGEGGIEAYLYFPDGQRGNALPLLVNVHGGAWIMGDALVLDTQSQIIADSLGAVVVNVNYKKADEKPFPYAQYEICDTVKHFVSNSKEYGIDTSKIILMGYSAGAHLCACASHMLRDSDIKILAQVLCYPFTDFTCGGGTQTEIKNTLDSIEFMDEVLFAQIGKDNPLASPAQSGSFSGMPKTVITTCGNDVLKVQGDEYARVLQESGNDVTLMHYENALHGFMEVNYPETKKDGAKSAEQEKLCKRCLFDIIDILKAHLDA